MPGYNKQENMGDNEYHKQSGFFVNFEIQQLYVQSSDMLSLAYQYGFKGTEGQKFENRYRRLGLDYFQKLVNKSIHLPDVHNKLMKLEEERRGFKDTNDLREKIATAVTSRVSNSEILKWWDAYVDVLVEVGLIKLYTMDDNPFAKMRR
jgi:hypothetical protein